MGLVFRGSSWRCWSKRASVFVCGLALASLPAVAQAPPQPPVNSDIAFRILPSKYNSLQMSPEVLQEQPLVRLLGEVASSYFGFDMVDDLDKAFEGTVVGAVLSDPKGNSSLADFFKDGELRGEREGTGRGDANFSLPTSRRTRKKTRLSPRIFASTSTRYDTTSPICPKA
jgi:hypothetical protein